MHAQILFLDLLLQIVFSESWWVGAAEENPEERQLPLPEELSTATLHKDYDYAYGASYTGRQHVPCTCCVHTVTPVTPTPLVGHFVQSL